ncbi:MAG: type II toxin-antitoxin system HipA family toxin [Bacteroidales bacterium]
MVNKLGVNKLEVFISDRRVGVMALTPDALCAFEYDAQWLQDGFSISPFELPLRSGVMIARRDPFAGGFGVFDDSLPDGWGNLILDRYLSEQGVNPDKLTLLDRLALIGSTGRGALEFRPDRSIASDGGFIDFDKLARDAEIILGDSSGAVSADELYRYGGSSGGARPKVFTSINSRHWLVKFRTSLDSNDIGEIEYNYSLLAKECSIIMSETKLFNSKYFAVERFDRIVNGKIHTISAAGLLGANYRIPSLDYSILMKLTLNLTRDMTQVMQMFRIMVFNVLISNRDDHAKNFSFQYIGSRWKLSPAYDLLPSSGFNGFHTTTINGAGEPTLKEILAVAKEIGIAENSAMDIINELQQRCKVAKMVKIKLL